MTKLVLFGDPDVTDDAEAIYTAIDREENVDLYVNGGDNFYNKEFEKGKAIILKHFPDDSEKRKKLRILMSNHDHEESEGPDAEAHMGKLFPDLYKTQEGFEEGDSSWEKPKWLWSEHLNDEVAFIGLNSQDEDIGFKRNQYNWAVSQINKFKELRKQNKCRWILAGVHKPWVTKKSSHSAYTNHREVYGDVFFNVVNAMFFDHNHNDHIFRSWKSIKKEGNAAIEIVESLLPDGKTIDHSKLHGMTGNINGHSGHEHNKFKEAMDVPEIIWHNDKIFSYVVVETNDKILNIKYKDKNSNALFEYNISDTTDYSKDGPVDECIEPNKCKDPTTGECREIGSDEIKDSTTGMCKKKDIVEPPPDGKETTSYEMNIRDEKTGQITKVLDQDTQTPEDKSRKYQVMINQKPDGPNDRIVSSFIVDVKSTKPEEPKEVKRLKPKSITATAQTSGKEAKMVDDDNFETRWSGAGKGQKLRFNFDKVYQIKKVELTGFHYDKTYFFEIEGKKFENKAGRAQNKLQSYDLSDLNIKTNSLDFIGHGNSASTYNSYREIHFYGIADDGTTPPPPPEDKCLEPNRCIDPTTGKCRDMAPDETKDPATGKCVKEGGPPPPPPKLEAKLKELIGRADVGKPYVIDGTQSTGNITTWDITQDTTDTIKVPLVDVPNLKYSKKIPSFPDTEDTLHFTLSVSDGTDTKTDSQTVKKSLSDGGDDFDEFGMKILMKRTGKQVTMEKGTNHRNGQRYNVNHKFMNHLQQGFYKIAKDQKKIETKEDGPNHGSCDFFDDQICFWLELGVEMSDGYGTSQYEWHHADNFDIPHEKNTVRESVGPIPAGRWVKWSTACYWEGGLRHYKAWIDPMAFPNNDPTQKPNNNDKLVIHLIHTADLVKKGSGNVDKPIKIPRNMHKVMDYDQGYECEIRMHAGKQTPDADYKNAFVYEIEAEPQPPTTN